MRIFWMLGLLFLASFSRASIDGVSLNLTLGQVTLIGDSATTRYSNAIGFGLDAGIVVNPMLDVLVSITKSSHSGDLSILNPRMSANFRVAHFYDVDLTVGGGPGLYSFSSSGSTETNFGLQFGTALDVVIEDSVRFGVGARYHSVFSPSLGASFWTVMMHVGYVFGLPK